ncbi:MAG: CPBP family intramembrane glutamic endopeptidase [Terriglobales bacterium]
MDSRPEALTPRVEAKLVAPLWHSLGLLIILLAISLGLLRMQSRTPATGEQQHGNVIVYISVIASEWAMTFYVWLGGLIPGATRLRDLVGGRWSNRKEVLRDIGLAVALWIAVTGVGMLAGLVLRPHIEPLAFLSPRGVAEVVLWVVMSVTAGFCEELVYRGYLQKQFLALTGNAALAVLAQALLFGVGHWYQGIKMVIIITLLGLLFGGFAYWRKSLRPGMIAHALGDIANLIA